MDKQKENRTVLNSPIFIFWNILNYIFDLATEDRAQIVDLGGGDTAAFSYAVDGSAADVKLIDELIGAYVLCF